MHTKTFAFAALSALMLSPAMAATLSFPDTVCAAAANGVGAFISCGNGGFVNQAHGDVAGQVDVSYLDVDSATGDTLRWWASGYNTLPSALWASGNDDNSFARITLTPAAGQAITLEGLDLGSYNAPTRPTTLRIFALGGATTIFNGSVGSAAGPTHFTPMLSSSTGIVIEWENSAYNVGINNISYSLAPVPEPETYALLLGGLAVVGWLARRRRTA
jgi:hypothetical protein